MNIFWIGFVLLLVFFGLDYGRTRHRKRSIHRWKKHLDLESHHTNFQQLFSNINGFELSRRSRLTQDAFEYTYGEIEFFSFIALIGLTKPNEQTVFYDLGSGVGKAVFACSMVYHVQKSCGIELFDALHQVALSQKDQLLQHSRYGHRSGQLIFIQANFMDYDFDDATLIFINATGFFGATWTAMNQKLNHLKEGTWVITSSKPLSSDAFRIIKVTFVCMSWGLVKAYIHQRVDSAIYSKAKTIYS